VPRTQPFRPAPLASAADVLDAVLVAASDPPEPETLVLLLDDGHVGHTCFVVSSTERPEDVLDVAHLVAELAERSTVVHAVVLASVRPEDPGDSDRWLELLDLFDAVDVELLDWFVIVERRAVSMRSRAGASPPLSRRES
jgi:hypothetical protein